MQGFATLIFPHQLFKKHPALQPGCEVYLIEETLFFNQYNFHKKKLVLHRASMKAYADALAKKGFSVKYIAAQNEECDVRKLILHLNQQGIQTIHYADVTDNWLQKRIEQSAAKAGIKTISYPTPMFLNKREEVEDFFAGKKQYFQTDFYIAQRKRRNLLLEKDGKPIGGKWSYDADNRSRFLKGEVVPLIPLPATNNYVTEAIEYVEKNYGTNYGNTEPPFFKRDGFYATTHAEAEGWLDDFLAQRFIKFGLYEDAMVKEQGLLYHSGLSMLLNVGLLLPQQVIDKALDAAVEYNVPLPSLEGFIRQIVGWREYIRLVYEKEGSVQRTKNFWGLTRKIPASFWNGTTGIHPIDTVVQKVTQNGYAHHIERLMVLGNFMLLCEFDPDEVYRWFMELFVDAFDWVMVPNTYGMICAADGGLMMTKPYISGSNYLLKMGNWKRGPWQQTWDALFWRFMQAHRSYFEQNMRLGMLLNTWDKMSSDQQQAHLNKAEDYLASLDSV